MYTLTSVSRPQQRHPRGWSWWWRCWGRPQYEDCLPLQQCWTQALCSPERHGKEFSKYGDKLKCELCLWHPLSHVTIMKRVKLFKKGTDQTSIEVTRNIVDNINQVRGSLNLDLTSSSIIGEPVYHKLEVFQARVLKKSTLTSSFVKSYLTPDLWPQK